MDWKFVDNVLEKYRQEYSAKQNDLKDELENEFIKYGKIDNLFGIVSESDLDRFKRFLERNEDYIKENGYCGYKVGKIKSRKRITYKEMLDIIVLVLFTKFQKEIYRSRYDTLSTIGSNVYSSTIKECEKLGHKPSGEIPLLDDLLIMYLLLPNEKGTTYQEQNDAQTIYNAEQISKQVTIDIMSKIAPDINADRYSILFERIKRQEINRKKDNKQKDKYSGIIDDQSTFIINQIKLQLLKLFGFRHCEFIGIEDERQTLMCKSLSNQIFNLTELNVYKRYSSIDKAEIEYKTVGMVVGENLPPITNHKHACRSFIMPFDVDAKAKNVIKAFARSSK